MLAPSADVPSDLSWLFVELGAAVIGLALLTRVANRWGFSAIPLYLLAGLSFGNGGLLPLDVSDDFIHVGAEIGVILLLFMLGLEYTGDDLRQSLRAGFTAGVLDLVLNFVPGLVFGLLLGWSLTAAVLLGGVTYISSSGVIAKIIAELGRRHDPETPVVVSILVIEDLAMALYLPIVSVLLLGQGAAAGVRAVLLTMIAVVVLLVVAIRYGTAVSRVVAHESDEIILLSTFGIVLLVAGLAQKIQISAAVGAFLVGVALSGPLVEQAHKVITPLRDLFAAVFFFFFGLQIDPATLPQVLPTAVTLGALTALSKMLTGWWAARRAGLNTQARIRAAAYLVARGEFSIVIAGLGVAAGVEPSLGPISAAYVLFLTVLGPLLVRVAEPLIERLERKRSQSVVP